MVKIDIRPYTNEFRDVINPGDEVIVITERYKSVKINKGIYIGMNGGSVVVEVPFKKIVWEDKTYTKFHYEHTTRRSHLQLNRVYPTTASMSSLVGKTL